jgi:hypothetical protein
MKSPDLKIKLEPVDSSSFLSSPPPQDKNKKSGQVIATIEISSDEEEDATPTPKAKQ